MVLTLFIFILSCVLCSSETINVTKNCVDNSATSAGDVASIFLLNRINEQLTSASVTSGNVIRKLENIESRLNKLETQAEQMNENFQIENKITKIRIENNDKSLESLKHVMYLSRNLDADYISNIIKNSSHQNLENYLKITSNNNSQNKIPSPDTQALNEKKKIPFDCSDTLRLYGNVSGVYEIQPPFSPEPISVYCDQSVRGGGWTVIQNRINGSLDFYRTWQEYKEGFGDPHGEYWLGLENIHLLTNHKINEVYFLLGDFNNDKAYAHYTAFTVGPESTNFKIKFLGSYEGTAGDSFGTTAGLPFSAYDRDNDSWPQHCAKHYSGAWWHKECFTSNLNGNYTKGTLAKEQFAVGVIWEEYKGFDYSLKSSRILVRPRVEQVTGV